MSHFYGTLQGARGKATRCATKKSGLSVTAAGWKGAVTVDVAHDEATGADRFTVELRAWHGSGGQSRLLAAGVLQSDNVLVFGSAKVGRAASAPIVGKPSLGPCSCKRGIERDNCPQCEGTGHRIDFAAIRAAKE